MSSQVSPAELSQAILQQVEFGAYPESEHVASANIPSTALPAIVEAVGKARETVKSELRELSRQSAPDIDGWIIQAKQLQADIERSKATAHEIVQEAEAGKTLQAHVKDASSKVELLRKELDFNVTLADTLEQLQIISGLLDSAQSSASDGQLSEALSKIADASKVIRQLDSYEDTRFAGLVQRRAAQLKEVLAEKVQGYWQAMVTCSPSERRIIILKNLPSGFGLDLDLGQVVDAMVQLQILDTHVARLHRDFDTQIIGPRFTPADDGTVAQLDFSGVAIQTSGIDATPNSATLLKDVENLIEFLTGVLPRPALELLLGKILPSLITQLKTDWLEPSVPLDLRSFESFPVLVAAVLELADMLAMSAVAMPSDADLRAWVDSLPQIWLAKRREVALTAMRASYYDGIKSRKTAERVETQMVTRDDVMVPGTTQEDDWNKGWSDDSAQNDTPTEDPTPGDDEDASAWGMEDDQEETTAANTGEDIEEEEAWGWGDDDTTQSQKTQPAVSTLPPARPKVNENGAIQKTGRQSERELTLRETFTITAVPESILELIKQILSDAEILSESSFPIPSISAAGPALSSLPTLLLALYRATARRYYDTEPASDMLIYNDSQHLANSLHVMLSELPMEHPLYKRLQRSVEADAKLLKQFSRLAYGREMDAQRTLLSDLLSSTSGFTNSTAPLNAREYEKAVDDVVATIRQLSKKWKGILSDSARLQSLGALLGHVIRAVVNDILELADGPRGISEEESKKLKEFCDQIADLADLFTDEGGKTMVHVYTPSWLRFGYLGEILDGTLADIKFLWMEGELSLEFEVDEVVELIEALFAESHHRRDAIREIKGK